MISSVLNRKTGKVLFACGITALIGVAAVQAAPKPIGGPCIKGIVCLAIYDPVTCPNGKTYPNSCEAYRQDCQTNCAKSGGI